MKLRVFGVVNHWGHQYELLKLADKYPVEFTYLLNNVRKLPRMDNKVGSIPPRPIPSHLKWAAAYEPGKYDVAILHVDQQHVNPDIGKGHLYKQMNEVIQDIPKIVINHGTPDYQEMYEEDLVINGGYIQTNDGAKWIDGMKQLIGDNFMVVNSYEAVNRWGWGYPVIHGLDPDEWWDLPKEPRVILPISAGGLDHYYNRQLCSYIKANVRDKVGLDVQHLSVNYQPIDWDDQRTFIGSALISIMPTKDSPMPRSRTEAMLSGSCIISSKYHNADEFIEHGVNGFIAPDNPLAYTEAIYSLINDNYREAVEIGKRGRETALKLFGKDRYQKDIWKVIEGVANGKPPKWDGKKIW